MKNETRKQYEELVARAIEHVRGSLDDVLSLEALGRKAHLSPLHFHRIFRGLLGETPGELHRRLRLERAGFSLAASQLQVTRIALEAGYETHESFTRAFASAFGLSPSEFRERANQNPTRWAAASASALPAHSGVHFSIEGTDAIRFTTEETTMHVTVLKMPAKRVFAVAHSGPYNMIGAAFSRLNELLSAATLKRAPSEERAASAPLPHAAHLASNERSAACGSNPAHWLEMVAIQYDDPETVPAAQLRSDAGIVVSEHVHEIPEGLHEVAIPAGVYARFTHHGPYDRLGDAWGRFMGQWLVKSGRKLGAGPCYERYLNTPENAAPQELLTELYLSLSDDEELSA